MGDSRIQPVYRSRIEKGINSVQDVGKVLWNAGGREVDRTGLD
jgi:hypothetical protein